MKCSESFYYFHQILADEDVDVDAHVDADASRLTVSRPLKVKWYEATDVKDLLLEMSRTG